MKKKLESIEINLDFRNFFEILPGTLSNNPRGIACDVEHKKTIAQ